MAPGIKTSVKTDRRCRRRFRLHQTCLSTSCRSATGKVDFSTYMDGLRVNQAGSNMFAFCTVTSACFDLVNVEN